MHIESKSATSYKHLFRVGKDIPAAFDQPGKRAMPCGHHTAIDAASELRSGHNAQAEAARTKRRRRAGMGDGDEGEGSHRRGRDEVVHAAEGDCRGLEG